MILGIGIDLIEIERFANWHLMDSHSLARILTIDEINYCKQNIKLSSSRFAARFTLREAAYKAFSGAFAHSISFLTFCRAVQVKKQENGALKLDIDWQKLGLSPGPIAIHTSITHSKQAAAAVVILTYEQEKR